MLIIKYFGVVVMICVYAALLLKIGYESVGRDLKGMLCWSNTEIGTVAMRRKSVFSQLYFIFTTVTTFFYPPLLHLYIY